MSSTTYEEYPCLSVTNVLGETVFSLSNSNFKFNVGATNANLFMNNFIVNNSATGSVTNVDDVELIAPVVEQAKPIRFILRDFANNASSCTVTDTDIKANDRNLIAPFPSGFGTIKLENVDQFRLGGTFRVLQSNSNPIGNGPGKRYYDVPVNLTGDQYVNISAIGTTTINPYINDVNKTNQCRFINFVKEQRDVQDVCTLTQSDLLPDS